jgi:citrate/tricarballylate utilization protein
VTVYFTASLAKGSDAISGIFTGPNSFYEVIPYAAMLVPFSILGILVAVAFWRGICNFWKETAAGPETMLSRQGNLGAMWDVLTLKYLEGGGHGCNYPDDEFSTIRRTLHHTIFYGFLACLASTTIAAIYDHVYHVPAPYPLLSWPVMLGTIGGVLIVIGTAGMLYLKTKMDPEPGTSKSYGMDVSFGLLLFSTSLTGLLLLALRESSYMGTLLILHLGLVLALFITMPFGKFVHGIYRYIALVRHSQEQKKSAEEH